VKPVVPEKALVLHRRHPEVVGRRRPRPSGFAPAGGPARSFAPPTATVAAINDGVAAQV
jgi:hypothetical protein